MAWLVAVALITCVGPAHGSDTCMLQTGLGRKDGVLLEESEVLNTAAWTTANGSNSTELALSIIDAVDKCLKPRSMAVAGNPEAQERLALVRTAEILARLVTANLSVTVLGEGYLDDAEMIAAAQMAGQDAAETMVRKEFEAEMLEILSGSNLTHDAIEHFTHKISKMVHMCSNGTHGTEHTSRIASDLNHILNTSSGYMTYEEAVVAMDISLYVEGLCQSEALDIDYFVGRFGDNASECSAVMLASKSAHVNRHLSRLDYYAKSVLVLHDERNNLAHHFARQLHPATRSPDAALVDNMIHNAASSYADNRPRMARLHYLDRTYYAKLHGHSKQEYCDMNARLAEEQPRHWIIQSPEIQAYAVCLCSERKPALLCDAEHAEPLARIRPQVAADLQEGARRAKLVQQDSGKPIGLGPCQDAEGKPAAVSCSICVNGNNCIDSGGGTTVDVFSAIKPLLDQPSSCMTGACTPCMGIKPGDPVQFKLDIGVDVASCASTAALMSTFNLFAELKMCVGGMLGEVADKLGWGLCQSLGRLSYYPFLNKMHLNIPLPIPLPAPLGVRGTLDANLNLGDLAAAVNSHCATKGTAGEVNCLQSMLRARGVLRVDFGVELLLGVRIPFVGEIGQWKKIFEFGWAERDNSRKIALNRAGATVVHIGSSSTGKVCGRALSGVNCEAHAADRGYRINEDWSDASDDFHIWVPTLLPPITSRSLCIMRTDANAAWAMNLEIACKVDNSNLGILVPIGSSTTREKCVMPDEPVTCRNDAGDPNMRAGFDNYPDDFHVYRSGDRWCARRYDVHAGWSLNLVLECEPTGVDSSYTVSTVHMGSSHTNVKCVLVTQTMECDEAAADDQNRVNDDCRNCGNRFFVSVDAGWVCARRVDHHGGWGLDLMFHCKDYGRVRDVVEVSIGASSSGEKCVTASRAVQCAGNAANLGYRRNTDWAHAPDNFQITTSGREVCAKRTDTDAAWAMNLKIACEAV